MGANPKRRRKGRDGGDLDLATAIQYREMMDQRGGSLPLAVVLDLVMGEVQLCPASCKGKNKDNPNCLCGLIPAEGSWRKKGLWQKEETLVASLDT